MLPGFVWTEEMVRERIWYGTFRVSGALYNKTKGQIDVDFGRWLVTDRLPYYVRQYLRLKGEVR